MKSIIEIDKKEFPIWSSVEELINLINKNFHISLEYRGENRQKAYQIAFDANDYEYLTLNIKYNPLFLKIIKNRTIIKKFFGNKDYKFPIKQGNNGVFLLMNMFKHMKFMVYIASYWVKILEDKNERENI